MKFIFLFLFFIFAILLNAQTELSKSIELFKDRKEIVFKFIVSSKDQINSDLTNIISIDQVNPLNSGGFEVVAYANQKEFNSFLKRNIQFEIVEKKHERALSMATTIEQMNDWDRYPTYSIYEQMLSNFASGFPNLCKIDTILSNTPSGLYKILVAKISDNINTEEGEPKILLSSSIHGDETIGYYLLLRLIDFLLNNYQSDIDVKKLVEGVEIWICPLANPDGTYNNSGSIGSTIANSTRYNFNGIDLNRNYPDPRIGANPDGEQRQPETTAFMNFADEHNFNLGVNLHSGAEVANYPWDTWNSIQKTNTDAEWWKMVCKNYVETGRTIDPNYLNSLTPSGVTNGGDWYIITGGRQDYMNYFKQCREFTLELDNDKITQTQNLNKHWEINRKPMLNFIREAMYGIRGIITDSVTGIPIKARVFAENYDIVGDSSHVYSALPIGNYHKYLISGLYNLTFSATGYKTKTIKNIIVTNNSVAINDVQLAPITSGINSAYIKKTLLYPNPVNDDFFTIEFFAEKEEKYTINIYNSSGNNVIFEQFYSTMGINKYVINIAKIEFGNYVLELKSNDFFTGIKFVK